MEATLDPESAERFVTWLAARAVEGARGDRLGALSVAPAGRLWLGRVAPEIEVAESRLGERAERLDPCAIGIRVRPVAVDGRSLQCRVRFCVWLPIAEAPAGSPDTDAHGNPATWVKVGPIEVSTVLETPTDFGQICRSGSDAIAAATEAAGASDISAEVQAELEEGRNGSELVITLVNQSPKSDAKHDHNLYEAVLEVDCGATEPFLLDELEDSFRYDRRVPAYGVNGGVEKSGVTTFRTTDETGYDQPRPSYWDTEVAGETPDLRFATLADDPVSVVGELVASVERWGAACWSPAALDALGLQHGWTAEMRKRAGDEASSFYVEVQRIQEGCDLLQSDATLLRAFTLANLSFHECVAIEHPGWRAFQIGFVLANLASIAHATRSREVSTVDTLWFATGGGKTETYLLFTLTAAFYDRLTGKSEGVTSWARFPLRMLSLQQTQRFADVFAAGELIRRREEIPGRVFSIGFLVGEAGTPNNIEDKPKPGAASPDDPDMPNRYRVLIRCPFCASTELKMRFERKTWMLDHLCVAADCPWEGRALPFRIVDYEIYRTLPTVVLGTLDKAASIAIQAAMRGFYGPPSGRCPKPFHGFTYAPRSKNKTGCLFPNCDAKPNALDQAEDRYAPTIRMQDELHLLRDTLGAVDSHYEALLDALQSEHGSESKIIASSATLAGHDEQVEVLYRRNGRTFPLPGPSAGHSIWSRATAGLARRYLGLAPRGVTIEYATDQLLEELQLAVRFMFDTPALAAKELRVDESALPALVSMYGTDVVYGSTLKDVEAASRSFESQSRIERVNAETLTGRTPLDEVRETLARLTDPEPDFLDRIHLVAASSMLSHGVDIDRLNIMVMLGLPLATAEFIQTTARVGRKSPGLVFVLHKIARERDAAVFRVFPSFVAHADRLIDPVPVTAHSRRVLELTFSGLELARILGIHEPEAVDRHLKQLTVVANLKKGFTALPVTEADELSAMIAMLGFTGALDETLRTDLAEYMREFFRALMDPVTNATFPSELFSTGPPMRSLRDVEDQVPIRERASEHARRRR